MKDSDLTIIIPVKNPEYLQQFIEGNMNIIQKYRSVIVDSGNGEALIPFSTIYLKLDTSMEHARKLGNFLSTEEYVLHLDSDTIINEQYIVDAIKLLKENPNITVVAIDYETSQGHYAFGTSVWRKKDFDKLYDFVYQQYNKTVKVGDRVYANLDNGWCECIYMWRKLINLGLKIETLNYRAKHLKEKYK